VNAESQAEGGALPTWSIVVRRKPAANEQENCRKGQRNLHTTNGSTLIGHTVGAIATNQILLHPISPAERSLERVLSGTPFF
jgi:hypothetical protein